MNSTINTHCGIYDDKDGGLTALGKLIREAWVIEALAEDQTCSGWTIGAFESLLDKVKIEKTKYGYCRNSSIQKLRKVA